MPVPRCHQRPGPGQSPGRDAYNPNPPVIPSQAPFLSAMQFLRHFGTEGTSFFSPKARALIAAQVEHHVPATRWLFTYDIRASGLADLVAAVAEVVVAVPEVRDRVWCACTHVLPVPLPVVPSLAVTVNAVLCGWHRKGRPAR